MLTKAEQRLSGEPDEVRHRVRLVQAPGEQAEAATGGQRFTAVLCHGVLMYVRRPDPLVRALCRCAQPGGIVSVMALNARTLAVRRPIDLPVPRECEAADRPVPVAWGYSTNSGDEVGVRLQSAT